MNTRILFIACRVLLGLVFLVACVHKIIFPQEFALAIYQYQILPDALVNISAITLPWIELVLAMAIMFSPRFKDGAALSMAVLLLIFTVAISFNILRGMDISCGCFSTESSQSAIGWGHVLRNLGYIFLTVVVLFEEQIEQQFEPLRKR